MTILWHAGLVDDYGSLHTMDITPDTAAMARDHGWVILEDYEPQMAFNTPRLVDEDHDGA